MRTAKQRLVALTLVLATVLGLGAVTPVTAIAAPACASELGLRPPSSEATAETPAVLLHGLWGDVDSMLAMSQSLESTKTVVPYRFDYKSANTAWVTVGDAAQRLARTIVCYSRMYGGKDVIIVAHSMGGLLAREALSRAAYGTFAKDVTGHVITIGTPHKGAPMGGGSYASNISLCDATFVWWGKEAADACNTIESAKAVSAMRPGSPELAALPRFPDGISVHAIAGDVRTARCMFLVCSPAFSTGGDLVVPIDWQPTGRRMAERTMATRSLNVSMPLLSPTSVTPGVAITACWARRRCRTMSRRVSKRTSLRSRLRQTRFLRSRLTKQ